MKGLKNILCLSFWVIAAGAMPSPAADNEPNSPVAGVYGNTGLWKIFVAQTLEAGRASSSLWYDRINRNPGRLTISTAGFSGAYAVTRRLELGVDIEVNRHVLVGRAEDLSFGQQALGFFGLKTPGATPFPQELVSGSSQVPQLRIPTIPSGILSGSAGYYNLLPFAGLVGAAGAAGSVRIGGKFRLLSESNGALVGLAAHGYFEVPIHKSIEFLREHPVGTADLQFGFDGIISRTLGKVAELHWNFGYRHINQPAHVSVYRLAGMLPMGIGCTIPRVARMQFIAESTAEIFVGSHTPDTTFGAKNPVDVTAGFRAQLVRSFTFSAGYRRPLHQFGGDKNGFVATLAFAYF
jgi:hypothetical protein